MSSILLSLPEFYITYKNWVSKNPQLLSDCETGAKWISYIIAGKISNSRVLSELVYCVSNLLVLFNDRIISNVRELDLPSSGDTLKLWLTIVEYCEVLFELTAHKLWGNFGRWFMVMALQIFKCISRLVLVFNHKEAMIRTPPINNLDRSNLDKPLEDNKVTNPSQAEFNQVFTLKSGRMIRKIEGAPPSGLRTWKPLQVQPCDNEQSLELAITARQRVAETIYIIKPVAHLGSLAYFGHYSWKPWVVSLLLDITSLHLYRSCNRKDKVMLSHQQRIQLSKRTVLLVMYLLRSPFYDRYSRDKVRSLLVALSNHIPLAKLICEPIEQYLPFWQSNYFYMWST